MSMGAVGEEFTEINVTPLTDVFLVLLVIMILIAPLIDKSDLKIKPPSTRNAKKDDTSKGITIDVDREGLIAVNGRLVKQSDPASIQAEMERFLKQTGRQGKDITCTVNADGDTKQKDVVAIMTAAAAAGIVHMRVATVQTTNY
jgi:biopolymer transport protein ExbD